MFADYTQKSAQEVADDLHAVMLHGPRGFFWLDTVRYGPDGKESSGRTQIRISPDTPEDGFVTILADGTEVVRCISRSGKKVDVILGRPDDRELQPAQVVFEQPD